MNVQPIAARLPRVHPDTARVSRIAFDARFRRVLAALSGGPPPQVLRRRPPEAPMLLEIAAGNGRFQLAVDTRAWPALEMALALDDEADACAVASVLMARWLDTLAPLLAAPRVVRRRRSTVGSATEACAVVDAPPAQVALVRMDDATQSAMRRALAHMPAHVGRSLSALQVRPRLTLLRRTLPASTLCTLEAGDIVLLDGKRQAPRVFTLTLGKGMTMQVDTTFHPDSGEPVASGEPAMRAEEAGPDEAATLDELQLPVSFEVDTARISLAELANIRAGYVIQLERPLSEASVRLVCHGQTVGHGQLVAVGDQMGVRILRMGLGGAPGDAA